VAPEVTVGAAPIVFSHGRVTLVLQEISVVDEQTASISCPYLLCCIVYSNTIRLRLSVHGVMTHSFKTISKASEGGGLILEGLKGLFAGWDETFCQGFLGVNPQRSDHGGAQWNFFEISSFRNRPSLQTIQIYHTALVSAFALLTFQV
jgi:hypothetical protein